MAFPTCPNVQMSKWNTEQVTTVTYLWNTEQVTTVKYLWNTEQVTSMTSPYQQQHAPRQQVEKRGLVAHGVGGRVVVDVAGQGNDVLRDGRQGRKDVHHGDQQVGPWHFEIQKK